MDEQHRNPKPSKADSLINAVFNPEETLASMLEWVGDTCNPGEVFDDAKLDEWARMKGYVKPPEDD